MASDDPTRPNILFVLTDDQGPWAMGCAGNEEIRTPTLDGLAATGTRLSRFFCASPVCSPARASLLTGQVPSWHGVHDYLRAPHVGPQAPDYLAGELLVSDVLADHGYRMGLSGKWHLGANDRPRRGFTHWFAHEAGGSAYHDAPMYRDGVREQTPGYLTDVLADDAISFIRQCVTSRPGVEEGSPTGASPAAGTQPFFLALNFTAPHSPWAGQHPPEIEALYEDCAFRTCPQGDPHPWTTLSAGAPLGGEPDTRSALVGYFAAVTAMDRALGRVVACLEELGLRESTLIVFTSDNGFNAGHHGIWGKGNGTWPLNVYDSSVMVPAIVSQPGRIAEGTVRDELVSAYDLAATLLQLAGLDPAPMETGPGRSFADLLVDDGADEAGNSASVGAERRVVVFDEYGPARMIRTAEWKYVHRWPDGPDELYHLTVDPGEESNLVSRPEVGEVQQRLAAELESWFRRHARPERDGQRLPVIGTGQAAPCGEPDAFQGPLWDETAGNSARFARPI
jgi:arylsulfatase A-like enzyme